MTRTARLRRPSRRRPGAEALEGRQLLAVTFGAPRTVASGLINQVAVGRLTGDGRDDLVVAEGGADPGIFVDLSNPDGSFRVPVKVATTLRSTNAYPQGTFALGDFLGNGRLDIAFSPDGRSIVVLPGRGDGTFGAPIVTPGVNSGGTISIIATTDFNGDRKADLLYEAEGPDPTAGGHADGVALGRGDGTFAAKLIDVNNMGYIPVAADFNGDGPADLATVGPVPASNYDPGGPGGIQFGHADGTFTTALPPYAEVNRIGFYPYLAVDFNGDGKPDLVTRAAPGPEVQGPYGPIPQSPGGPAAVALNRGDGTFGPRVSLVDPPDPTLAASLEAATAVDLNGDGKLDVVVARPGSPARPGDSFFLLPGGGDGTFRPPVYLGATATTGIGAILTGDFKGDGRPDVVALSARSYGSDGLPEPQILFVLPNSSAVPPTFSGHLDPASDTGASKTDLITADTTPTFDGRSAPGARITLLAHRVGVPGFVTVATTTAGADGTWRATTSPLHPGPYLINAQAVAGGQAVTTAIVAQPRPLQIQAAPPEITAAALDPAKGRLTITFRATGPGGLDLASLTASGALSLSPGLGRNPALAITALALSPQSGTDGTQTLMVTFVGGRTLSPNLYTLLIRSAVVRNVAGLALDGEYLGHFPTGSGRPGGDFATRFLVVGGRATGPIRV